MICLADTESGDAHRLISTLFQGFNDTLNLLGRHAGFTGQGTNFISDYSKTSALFTSPGCFNCRIEGQQVGLISNRLDYPGSGHDLMRFIGEVIHRSADVCYRICQKLNCLSSGAGYFVALFGQCIRCSRLGGGLLNMPRDLTDRARHVQFG
ncbi:hypothetical protein D3C84_829920 [compost metagenome]